VGALMPCRTLPIPGGTAIVCTRGRRAPTCEVCRTRPASKLCDGRGADRCVCSRRLCSSCAVSGGHDIDFCPAHASAGEQARLL